MYTENKCIQVYMHNKLFTGTDISKGIYISTLFIFLILFIYLFFIIHNTYKVFQNIFVLGRDPFVPKSPYPLVPTPMHLQLHDMILFKLKIN